MKTKKFCYSKELRLLKSVEYKSVLNQQEIVVKNKAFVVIAKPTIHMNPRLGIIVSKRNIPKAVNRNYIKRIIKESFRLNRHHIGNYDIIVVVRREANLIDKFTLRECAHKQWYKLITS